jgi:polar amino acid transport system permease protein
VKADDMVGTSAPVGVGYRSGPLERLWRSQRPSGWIWTALIVVVAAAGIFSVARNDNFEWGTVGDYLLSRPILTGLARTLELTAIGSVVGFLGGVLLAVMGLSGAPVAVLASKAYVWFFRGTPLLVQLIFWFNLGALYRVISFGIPWGPAFWHGNANDVVTPFSAAVLGLGLNAAAYFSEIVRAGIQSIHHGQTEAAHALGLTKAQTLFSILLPQAMRVIVPPAFNEMIGMLKYSSLVSVLAVPDLLYSAQLIYARNYKTIPLLIVVSIWYLVGSTVLTVMQHYLERYYAKGVRTADKLKTGSGAGAAELQGVPAVEVPLTSAANGVV